MNLLRELIEKINIEDFEEENTNELLANCIYCNSDINIKAAYINKDNLNIYCCKECFLRDLSSKYY